MRAVVVVFFLPLICSYRLIYDVPYRGAVNLPAGMPPPDQPDVEPTYVGLPGFLTAFESCFSPPLECPNENITFWFYTRSTQNNPVKIDLSQPETLEDISPDEGKPWRLIIHGYTGFRDYAPNPEIRSAYFEHSEYNIISVDYGIIAKSPCYYSAMSNVPLVANCTAQLLDALISRKIFLLKELHVIGFSLGAQVCGHLPLFLKSGVLDRITGLDPAMPLFITKSTDKKLSEDDARFVDVIHTNAAYKGYWSPSGHVDFYVNGGYAQPGCTDAEYGSFSSCNHARSVRYYAESISSEKGFWAVPCGSAVTYYWGWCPANETNEVIMGEYTPYTARGSYYLETEGSPPFAMGKELPCHSSEC